MNGPIYQAWRTITPIIGEPIPGGAEWSTTDAPDCWDSHYERWDDTTFSNEDLRYKWRAPVPVIPEDVAVDAVMADCEWDASGYFAYVKGKRMVAETPERLRELVIAKLRELSQGESCN